MKRALLIAVVIILLTSTVVMLQTAKAQSGAPLVGVKEGDWIEYDISVAGTGALPPTHDVRWMRMGVLQVQGAAFSVNLTSRYANGTLGSAVWRFNFTEGNTEGWLIIPANLSAGDSFYDASIIQDAGYVTIQGQEQRTVLGASRTITYGNDSFRHKDWDKVTGVFVGSLEHLKNVTNKYGWYIEDITVTIHATATNMWSPRTMGLDQPVFYAAVAAGAALAILIVSSVVIVARRKMMKTSKLQRLSQGKIAVLTVFLVILAEAAMMTFFPFYEIGLGLHEINLIMQTFWTALILVSMWFRAKGNYFLHEITMLIVVTATLVSFSTVLFMSPPSGDSMGVYFTSAPHFVVFMSHAILSIPAIIFGVWLVALWRPESKTFPAKSKRIAQLAAFMWVLSHVAGVLGFIWLHTPLFG